MILDPVTTAGKLAKLTGSLNSYQIVLNIRLSLMQGNRVHCKIDLFMMRFPL
jgi:hypothetical protein